MEESLFDFISQRLGVGLKIGNVEDTEVLLKMSESIFPPSFLSRLLLCPLGGVGKAFKSLVLIC